MHQLQHITCLLYAACLHCIPCHANCSFGLTRCCTGTVSPVPKQDRCLHQGTYLMCNLWLLCLTKGHRSLQMFCIGHCTRHHFLTYCMCMQMCRRLAQKEGMLVGGSAGLNLHAAVEISKTAKPGSVIVAILADNGVKYLTKIYNNDWIKAKVRLSYPPWVTAVCV